MQPLNTEKSKQLFLETSQYLVDGVASSFHKAPEEEYPVCMTHGKGSKLYDVDGNEYIDYVAGFGPAILGFCPEGPTKAIEDQMTRGTQFSATTPQLCQLAKRLTEILPCAEKVMFQNTGTEAVMTAFRVARAYTKRNKIVKFEGQYHGWSDEEKVTIDANAVSALGPIDNINKIVNTAGQRVAAVDDVIVAPWNDIEALEKIFAKEKDTIACVIMEPVMFDSGPIRPKEGYHQAVKALCEKNGALLIFDEVITGFRLSLGGAQQYFGVTPHVATFAKAVTAGYGALAIVAGRKDIMDAGVKTSGTFNANPLAVASALATIDELAKPGTYEKFEKLGNMMATGLAELGKKHNIPMFTHCYGSVVMMQFGATSEAVTFREFLEKADVPRYQKMFITAGKYGVRLASKRGRIYLTTAHSEEDIKKTLEILDHVFGLV